MDKESAKSQLSGILEYFKQTYKITTAGKESIRLDSTTYTSRQFFTLFCGEELRIAGFIGQLEFYRMLDFISKEKGFVHIEESKSFVAAKVFGELKRGATEEKNKKVVNLGFTELLAHSFDWSGHFAVIDIKTKQKVMYNSRSKNIDHAVSFASWCEYLKTLSQDAKSLAMSQCAFASITYDPYSQEEAHYANIGSQENVLHINAHKSPSWRKIEISEPKLPKEFLELMEHLFPGEKCRSYVYHWMNFMLTLRNHCYLLLHGEQGIGKNTLVHIMERLVGTENYSYVEPSFWDDTKFNSELKHKRVVFFDETVVTKNNTTALRSYTNKYLAITEKGVDTINYENFCSFIIANNLDKVNQISYDDRRYSVPVLSKVPIKHSLGLDWLDRFYVLLEDDDFVANIGNWIIQYGNTGEFNEKQPYLTEYFYDIVEKGLSQWQHAIIQEIETQKYDEIPLEDLKKHLTTGAANVGRVKLAAFLGSHRDREGEIYGTLGQNHEGVRVLRVSKKYWPEHALEFERIQEEEASKNNYNDLEF